MRPLRLRALHRPWAPLASSHAPASTLGCGRAPSRPSTSPILAMRTERRHRALHRALHRKLQLSALQPSAGSPRAYWPDPSRRADRQDSPIKSRSSRHTHTHPFQSFVFAAAVADSADCADFADRPNAVVAWDASENTEASRLALGACCLDRWLVVTAHQYVNLVSLLCCVFCPMY